MIRMGLTVGKRKEKTMEIEEKYTTEQIQIALQIQGIFHQIKPATYYEETRMILEIISGEAGVKSLDDKGSEEGGTVVGSGEQSVEVDISLRHLVIDCKMTNGQFLTMLDRENITVPRHCYRYLVGGLRGE